MKKMPVGMKNLYKNPVLYSYLLVTLLVIFSCSRTISYDNFAGFAQGTTYSMVFENDGSLDPEEIRADVEKILRDFDLSLSLYVDSSVLCRVNRNEDVVVDRYFTEAFEKSVKISAITEGAFDITVGPLVKAWGFGPDEQRNFMEDRRDSLLRLVGMDKVRLENGRVIKSDPGIVLDLNAIAQGYSVDVIAEYFNSRRIRTYLVEIGGEVRTRGDKQGVPWRIGIDRPEENNNIPGSDLQAIINLKNRSLATSGNYRKFYVEDGIKYSHTIDPRTGYPARNKLLSATVIASDCATADGIATACMVFGMEKTLEFLKLHNEFDAFLVYSDEEGKFRTWSTDNLKKSVSEQGY